MRKMILLLTTALLLLSGCSGHEEPLPDEPGKIIVLMYHRIVTGEATDEYERTLMNLEADFKYLKSNNVNIISFNDLEKVSTSGKMPPGNSAIITFDDGDQSFYTLVRPLLLQYRMKATFFLWTYMIGHDSFMTWNEVEQMSYYTEAGGVRPFTFGSHTYSHAYLLKRKPEFGTLAEYNSFLDYELRESRLMIENHAPGDISALSLPYGDGAEDPGIISAAQRNGYKFIRTSKWGAIDNASVNLFAIPSLPVLDKTNQSEIGQYLDL